AQAKTLAGIVGRLLQPAVVEHQCFGLAVFQEQFAVVGAGEPAPDLVPDGVAVEIGSVEQGGGGGDCHRPVPWEGPLSEGTIQDSCLRVGARGAGWLPN